MAVEGSAWTDNPVECELTDRAAVISKVLFCKPGCCCWVGALLLIVKPKARRSAQQGAKSWSLGVQHAGSAGIVVLTSHFVQVDEHQHRLRRVNGRDARDTQRIRSTKREAHWYLKDGSHVRLPVIGGAAAAHLELELAGAP